MKVVFRGWDREGGATRRLKAREAHRIHIRRADDRCRCILGGPLLSAQGEMIGTMLVFDAVDAGAVTTFMGNDPYTLANLFDRVDIVEWRIGLGNIC